MEDPSIDGEAVNWRRGWVVLASLSFPGTPTSKKARLLRPGFFLSQAILQGKPSASMHTSDRLRLFPHATFFSSRPILSRENHVLRLFSENLLSDFAVIPPARRTFRRNISAERDARRRVEGKERYQNFLKRIFKTSKSCGMMNHQIKTKTGILHLDVRSSLLFLKTNL